VLNIQPLPSLRQLAGELAAALSHAARREPVACQIGGRQFCWGERTYVMGIINVTPDSFSGDGLISPAQSTSEQVVAAAVERALTLLGQGADIIDVGGESTRPGGVPVDEEMELARVIPVVCRLREATDAPISIDSYKAAVASAALDAGADMVNDVWGLQMDPQMAPLVATREVPVVLMHNRSRPKDAAQAERLGGHYVGVQYDDLLADVLRELRAQVDRALEAGIDSGRIIIDPGIGFGKTVEQNLRLLNRLDELRVLGFPILLGPSRKSFVGHVLDLPPEERLEGTMAATAVGVLRGADIVRVHDVQPAVRVVRMVDAILRERR
jgi:dihydropteroate synthase